LVNIIKIITKRFSRNPTKARMPVVSPINKISISYKYCWVDLGVDGTAVLFKSPIQTLVFIVCFELNFGFCPDNRMGIYYEIILLRPLNAPTPVFCS
jgi:hypothetical protein